MMRLPRALMEDGINPHSCIVSVPEKASWHLLTRESSLAVSPMDSGA